MKTWGRKLKAGKNWQKWKIWNPTISRIIFKKIGRKNNYKDVGKKESQQFEELFLRKLEEKVGQKWLQKCGGKCGEKGKKEGQ